MLFRAWHRGTREVDLITGRFADAHIETLSDADIGEFERLMEVPEQDLYGWVTGAEATPAPYDTAFFRRLRAFHLGGAA